MSARKCETIPDDALHLVIDMQRLFAEPTVWHAPALADIVPRVEALCDHVPRANVFTRFVTPPRSSAANGRWQHYYEHWQSVTLEHLDEDMLGIIEPLTRFIPPGLVVDKTTHSAFNDGELARLVRQRGADTLILSGVETDVCVLATALDAVDHGYRVVIARDAVASSSSEGHAAALAHIFTRTDLQIDLCTSDTILGAWQAGRA